MKRPEPIEVDEAEVQRLIDKAEQGQLDGAEQRRLVPLLKTLLWLEHALVSTRISISKLKRLLFGHKTERRKRKKDSDDGEGGASGGPGAGSDRSHGRGSNGSSNASASSDSSKAQGHGRRAAADYPGAEVVFCPHPSLQSGCRCPECVRGRLYPLSSAVRRHFHGQALAQVIV